MASTLIFGDIPRDYRPDSDDFVAQLINWEGLRIAANLDHLYLSNELVRQHLGMSPKRFAGIADQLDLGRETNPYLLAAARSVVETLGKPSLVFVRERDLLRTKSHPACRVTPEVQALDDRICLLLQLLREKCNPNVCIIDERLRPSLSDLEGVINLVRHPFYQVMIAF